MATEARLLRPHRLVVVIFPLVRQAELAVFAGRGGGDISGRRMILEVIEDCLVEPRIALCVALLGPGPRIEHLPIVGLALEVAPHRFDHPGELGIGLPGVPVRLDHDRVDEVAPGAPGRRVDELLGEAPIPPEAARDQHEEAEAEQEAALPLEARLPQDVGEGTVGHGRCSLRLNRTPPAGRG